MAKAASAFFLRSRQPAMVEHGSRLAVLNGLPVHVPAVSPRELTGTTALMRGILPGARGGIQILGMVSALTAVVDVAAFSSAEKQELVALVQSRQASDVDDSELSAPAAAVYVSHSSDFVDVLNDCWTRPNLYWT